MTLLRPTPFELPSYSLNYLATAEVVVVSVGPDLQVDLCDL